MRKHLAILLILIIAVSTYGCSFPANSDTNDFDRTAGQNSEKVVDKEETVEPEEPEEQKSVEEKKEADVERLPVTLYYQDEDGYLVPVTRRIVKQVGIARAALGCLIDSSSSREELEYFGLYPVLPKGTEILGINIKDGTAIVDFNEKFLDYTDSTAERNIICSVVYTLTEFSTINGVKILINGYEKGKLKYGADISKVLDRKNVLVNTDGVNLGDGFEKSDIYVFKSVRDSFVYTLPVSVEHQETAAGEKPEVIVELLADGLFDENLYSEVPEGVKLRSSKIDNSTLILDFDGSSVDYGGSSREEGILKQILYSMAQVEGVDRVKIMLDGKSVKLPEGTDISKEILLPKEINNFIDR